MILYLILTVLAGIGMTDLPSAQGPNRRTDTTLWRDRKEKVSLVRWAKFLDLWSVDDLNTASRMLRCGCYNDLAEKERKLLQTLRDKYADLLFLKKDDGLKEYQKTLRRLHNLGILNLHLTSVIVDRESELRVSV